MSNAVVSWSNEMYSLYYTNDAKKDFKQILQLKVKNNCLELLQLARQNPLQDLPSYKKLQGVYCGMYSRRINIQHRLFYEIDESNKRVKILRMWCSVSQ